MYSDINEILEKLHSHQEISWQKAYDTYESSERSKWLQMHGERMTSSHFESSLRLFSEKVWYQGEIKIENFYPITLCPSTHWIQELACSRHQKGNCKRYSNTTPTLEQLIKNIEFNQDSLFYPKILSIQDKFRNGTLRDPFVILLEDDPQYVYDGNSRLISIASLSETEYFRVKSYLGCNKKMGFMEGTKEEFEKLA